MILNDLLRLADNQLELTDWDQDLLAQELMELQRVDYPIDVIGFSAETAMRRGRVMRPRAVLRPDLLYLAANLPRSVFLKRASNLRTFISRRIDA